MKTFMPKQAEIQRNWWVVDASNIPLGRLASQVAYILRGKNKPTYTTHQDNGDYVIVVNSDKVALTGNKLEDKYLNYHTLYPGGDKHIQYKKLMKENSPRAIEHAVKGMLPKNALGRKMFKKLFVYAGETHNHQAQNPQPLKLKGGR